jgi:LysR family cyn operon transcriptional activator
MELRQLRYFLRSAELLNFTEAAHALYISQSTLSQQIKQLEDELGVMLFDRIGKRVLLTEAGKKFLDFARQSIQHAELGRQVMQDLKGIRTGALNIGVTYGLSTLLTSTIVSFSQKHPEVNINVDFGSSEDLLEKLKLGKLDFILSFLQIPKNNQFELQPLFESSMSLIVHPNHPLAKKKKISIKELKDVSLVMPTKGFNTRYLLDKAFEKYKIKPLVKIELNDINTLLQLVETGNWCTILTIASVKDRQTLKTIPIAEVDIVRKASIIWPKERYRKNAALAFAKMIQQQAQ